MGNVGAWIPVTVDLPEFHKTVLVRLENGECRTASYKGGGRFLDESASRLHTDVAYWMPLPMVPTEPTPAPAKSFQWLGDTNAFFLTEECVNLFPAKCGMRYRRDDDGAFSVSPGEPVDSLQSAESGLIDSIYRNIDMVIEATGLLKGNTRSAQARELAILITDAEKLKAWAAYCFRERDNG